MPHMEVFAALMTNPPRPNGPIKKEVSPIGQLEMPNYWLSAIVNQAEKGVLVHIGQRVRYYWRELTSIELMLSPG